VQLKLTLILLAFGLSAALLAARSLHGSEERELGGQLAVSIYLYHAGTDIELHGHVACSAQAVLPVRRHLPPTDSAIRDTLELLFQGGPTPAEEAQGFSTEFPLPGVQLTDVRLTGTTLELDISDPEHRTTGGACRTTIMWAQIEKTALQFEDVEEVRAPDELFEP